MDQNQIKLVEKTSYFHLIQKVGTKGWYQFMIFAIFSIMQFITGFFILSPSFYILTTNPVCPGISSQSDCLAKVCSLSSDQRQAYYPSVPDSIVYSFGTFYICQKQIAVTAVVDLLYVGIFIGYFGFSFIIDNYGRKFSLFIAWTIGIIGFLLISISWNIWVVGIGFFLTGAGIQPSIQFSFYIFNQQIDYKKRQYYSIIIQLFYCLGGMTSAGVFYIIPDWRKVTLYILLIPSIMVLFSIYFMVQNPQFLIKKGIKTAISQLNKIARMNGIEQFSITQQDIQNIIEMQKIRDEKQHKKNVSIVQLFKYKSNRTPTIYMTFIAVTISILYTFPELFLQNFGLSVYINQVLLSVSQAITYIITSSLITQIKRKSFGLINYGIILSIVIVLIFIKVPENCYFCKEEYIQICLMCVVRFFVAMYYSVFLLYIAEIFPQRIRGIGAGTIVAAGVLFSSPFVFLIPVVKNPFILFVPIIVVGILSFIPLRQTLNACLKQQIEQIENQIRQSIVKTFESDKKQLIITQTKSKY